MNPWLAFAGGMIAGIVITLVVMWIVAADYIKKAKEEV